MALHIPICPLKNLNRPPLHYIGQKSVLPITTRHKIWWSTIKHGLLNLFYPYFQFVGQNYLASIWQDWYFWSKKFLFIMVSPIIRFPGSNNRGAYLLSHNYLQINYRVSFFCYSQNSVYWHVVHKYKVPAPGTSGTNVESQVQQSRNK